MSSDRVPTVEEWAKLVHIGKQEQRAKLDIAQSFLVALIRQDGITLFEEFGIRISQVSTDIEESVYQIAYAKDSEEQE